MPNDFRNRLGLSNSQWTTVGGAMVAILVLGVGMGLVLNPGSLPESGAVRLLASQEDAAAADEQAPAGSSLPFFGKTTSGSRTPAKPPFAVRRKEAPDFPDLEADARRPADRRLSGLRDAVGGSDRERLHPIDVSGGAWQGAGMDSGSRASVSAGTGARAVPGSAAVPLPGRRSAAARALPARRSARGLLAFGGPSARDSRGFSAAAKRPDGMSYVQPPAGAAGEDSHDIPAATGIEGLIGPASGQPDRNPPPQEAPPGEGGGGGLPGAPPVDDACEAQAGGMCTRTVTCDVTYFGNANTWGCTAACADDEVVTGGGAQQGAAYTNGGAFSKPDGNGWTCNVGGITGCSAGTAPCGTQCYAVCAKIAAR